MYTHIISAQGQVDKSSQYEYRYSGHHNTGTRTHRLCQHRDRYTGHLSIGTGTQVSSVQGQKHAGNLSTGTGTHMSSQQNYRDTQAIPAQVLVQLPVFLAQMQVHAGHTSRHMSGTHRSCQDTGSS
jgi:hypothetical protein